MDLELNIVQVKDNLKKAEAGPVTLGTTVDTTHLENVSPQVSARSHGSSELLDWSRGEGGGHVSLPWHRPYSLLSPQPKAAAPAPDCTPVNSATALKNRPLSVMVTGKGTVLQKAKVSGHSRPPSRPPVDSRMVTKLGPLL